MAGKSRNTPQKRAIEEAFKQCNRPLTVPEAHALARQTCARLGVATVYRSVNRLVESGWLKEVCLPNQPIRYERASLGHHHHFHCQECKQVMDSKATYTDIALDVPDGFQVIRHELTFYGICPDCGDAETS